jgi:lipid-binding SYLF domain-containing protein
MIRPIRMLVIALAIGVAVAAGSSPPPAHAASAAEIDRSIDAALQTLYEQIPAARNLSGVTAGILVFPNVVKAGFIIGGQYGEGALRQNDRTVAYYNTVAASYGLQAGAQSFGYALFFMTEDALSYIDQSAGWEVGVGPSVVVVDEGLARTLTTTTARNDVYAFIFGQRGLMAGLGLQGSKISRIAR